MTHVLCLANDDQAPAQANEWIARHCALAGLNEERTFKLTTCVVEAVNNAALYRRAHEPGPITLRVFRSERLLAVRVRDSNASAEGSLQDCPRTPDAIGGRGWFIIRSWADASRYRRRGSHNVVTIAMRTSRDQPGS